MIYFEKSSNKWAKFSLENQLRHMIVVLKNLNASCEGWIKRVL